MRSRELVEFLTAVLPAGENVWIVGPPGIGKTEICEQAVNAAGMRMWRHKPGITMDPVDLNGLPHIDKKNISRWARSQLWPTKEDVAADERRIVIFLDELSQASTPVQCGYMQAVQSKRIGDMELDPSIVFLATGNRIADRAGVSRIVTPLLGRFTKIDMEVNNEDWQSWAIGAGIEPEVRGFINFRPNMLHSFDPAEAHKGSCDPRSWHAVSKLLPHLTKPSQIMAAASGRVGGGPAAEFCGFLQTYRDLPDLDLALKNPDKTAIPTGNPAVMYALSTALAEKSRTLDNIDALATYAMRFQAEFSALCLRETFEINATRNPSGHLTVAPKCFRGMAVKWTAKHNDILNSLRTG